MFHDGTVVQLDGRVPGDLVLRIEIPYLREMFGEGGDAFDVHLEDCSQVEYAEYGEPPATDLRHIAARQPEILSVASTPSPVSSPPIAVEPAHEVGLVLNCAMGTLTLAYRRLRISLDTGEAVAHDRLVAAAAHYWRRWQST